MTRAIEQRMRCRKPGCSRRFTRPQGSRRIYCTECSPPRRPTGVVDDVASVRVLPVDAGIVSAVRADLERCGAVGTLGGAIALRLAAVLDDPTLGAAQVSTLAAQLQKTMAPILESAPREPDELDAMRQRLAGLTGGTA